MNTSPFYRHARKTSRRGFTLMEMIIVLTIIALLVALAMNTLTGVTDTARERAAEANITAFKTALYSYQLETGSLPTTEQGLKALWSKPTVEPIPTRWHAMFTEDQSLDPWNHPYQYLNPGKHNPDSFDVFSMGPDGLPDTDDDIGNWADTPAAKNQ
ncbi:MAG TPA: type II secretion system major pseudopilin GspG [Candidatus Methylacidiphilales bacterium]|jgi:general secretion pathway protein G|nr:type II secretion system major pseudopilin GspG [Candidatus Methylacidiphilales bacterium]